MTYVTEIDYRARIFRIRKNFSSQCRRVLGLPRPPRESFNRWLQDVYCAGISADLFHSFISIDLIDNVPAHLIDLGTRIVNHEIGSHLFWEIIDELGCPIPFPRSSGEQFVLSERSDRKRKREDVGVLESPKSTSAQIVLGCSMEFVKDTEKILTSLAFDLNQLLTNFNSRPSETTDYCLTDTIFGSDLLHKKISFIREWSASIISCSSSHGGCILAQSVRLLMKFGLMKINNDDQFNLVDLSRALKELQRPLIVGLFEVDVLDVLINLERSWHMRCITPMTTRSYSINQSSEDSNNQSKEILLSPPDSNTSHVRFSLVSDDSFDEFVIEISADQFSSLWKQFYTTNWEMIEHQKQKSSDFLASEKIVSYSSIFIHSLVSVILRYEAISGPEKHGGRGLQAGVPIDVWNILIKYFNIKMECFASPFNNHLNNYLSLFPDIDRHFGSKGSFFDPDLRLCSGSFQLNPPFVEPLMERMAIRLIDWLSQSEDIDDPKSGDPLTFVVFVPDWDNGTGCRFMNILIRESKELGYLSSSLKAEPFQHQYRSHPTANELIDHRLMMRSDQSVQEESQNSAELDNYIEEIQTESHRIESSRNETVKDIQSSNFDSISPSIIVILQNRKGKEKWPITEQFCTEILNAWRGKNIII